MNTSVLSQYPFSLDYRQKLEQDLGMTPSYITVSELRDLGIQEIWRRLRAIEADRLLIPLEDENAHAVLPLLKIMAGISSARQVSILTAGHKCVTAKRTGLVNDVLTVGRASVAGRLAAAGGQGRPRANAPAVPETAARRHPDRRRPATVRGRLPDRIDYAEADVPRRRRTFLNVSFECTGTIS